MKNDLFKVVSQNTRGRRKASCFNLIHREDIHPSKRMIGNIEVFIDPPSRKNYELEDYAKFIEKELKEYC